MRAPLLSRTATARTATMMTTTGRRGSGGGRWERRPRRRCQRDVRGGGRGDARGGRLRRRRGDARGGLCEVSVGGGRAAGWKGEGDEEEADRPREEEEEVVGRQEEGAGGQKKNEKSDGKKKKKPSDDEKKPNRGKKWPYGKKKKKPEDPRTKRKSARRRGVQTRALTAPRSGRGPSCLRPVVAAGRERGAPVAASASEDSQEESTARAGKPFGSGGRLSIGLFMDLSDDGDVQAVIRSGAGVVARRRRPTTMACFPELLPVSWRTDKGSRRGATGTWGRKDNKQNNN